MPLHSKGLNLLTSDHVRSALKLLWLVHVLWQHGASFHSTELKLRHQSMQLPATDDRDAGTCFPGAAQNRFLVSVFFHWCKAVQQRSSRLRRVVGRDERRSACWLWRVPRKMASCSFQERRHSDVHDGVRSANGRVVWSPDRYFCTIISPITSRSRLLPRRIDAVVRTCALRIQSSTGNFRQAPVQVGARRRRLRSSRSVVCVIVAIASCWLHRVRSVIPDRYSRIFHVLLIATISVKSRFCGSCLGFGCLARTLDIHLCFE